jgi:4-amino-4-deoxy-L-arabinose transferase-like glycosyltransferase
MKKQSIKKHILDRHTHVLLSLILLLALVLRIWALDTNPPGIMPDEADIGYAAYSVMETGKTQYNGMNLVLFEEGASGFYPPVYSYVLIPFIKLFGLNIIVERLPSAFFGTISCFLFYLLITQIFKSQKIGLVGALLMSINPWSLFYSRQGRFEMIGIFLMLSGIVLFLHAANKQKYWLYISSAVAFGLSLHANDATKLVIPLLLIALFVYSGKQLWKEKTRILSFIVVFSIFFLLLIKVIVFDGQIGDYTRSSGAHTEDIAKIVNAERQYTNAPLFISKFFHNKATVLFNQYVSEFASIFSLNWFFIQGHGHLQESIGKHGQYLLFELPFFFYGLYIGWRYFKRETLFLLAWVFLGNIPGAITSGHFFPYRSILFMPVPIIFSSIGIVYFWVYLRMYPLFISRAVKFGLLAICFMVTSSFLFTFFFDYPYYSSEWRFKQRTDALKYAHTNESKYEKIFISGRFETTHAFLKSVNPKVFQQAYASQKTYNDVIVMSLGKYTFGSFDIKNIATPSAYFPTNSLVIADADALNASIEPIYIFTGVDPLRKVYAAFEVE